MKTRPAASRLIAGFVLAAALGTAQAETPKINTEVNLAEVLRMVREVSPRLEIERMGVAQAEANRITSGAFPNPTINYGRLRPSSGQPTILEGSKQQQLVVEQPLLLPGQRAARIERADREIEAARARVASGTSSLAAEAASAFAALLAAQDKASALAMANSEVERLLKIITGREAGGAASRYDSTRVEVELGGLRARWSEAKAEVADRAGNLAALLGLKDWRPSAAGQLETLHAAYEADGKKGDDRLSTTPAYIAVQREEEAAQSGIEVARRERWPVMSLNAGRAWSSDPFGAANQLGLSVELPLFDSRRGPLARAKAEARAASLRRQLITAELEANMRRLKEIIAHRRESLERFDQDATSRIVPLKAISEDAYRLGKGSLLELLDAVRSRHDMLLMRIDLAAALADAQLRLLALSGNLNGSGRSTLR